MWPLPSTTGLAFFYLLIFFWRSLVSHSSSCAAALNILYIQSAWTRTGTHTLGGFSHVRASNAHHLKRTSGTLRQTGDRPGADEPRWSISTTKDQRGYTEAFFSPLRFALRQTLPATVGWATCYCIRGLEKNHRLPKYGDNIWSLLPLSRKFGS